jgi:protein-disulfide isomerase
LTDKTSPGESSSRRGLLIGGGLVIVAAIAAVLYFQPFRGEEAPLASASVSGGELMQDQPLPDMAIGAADAPVTIVEYASMTCGACGAFHKNVYPELKSKYIDTGQVRYILREFPLDRVAAAAFMLARCGGDDRYYALIDALFETQESWAFGEGDPTPRLQQFARQAGISEEQFNQCISNEEMLKQIAAVRERAHTKFGVDATPTFFINGTKLETGGGVDLKALEAAMEPYLNKTS